MISTLEYEQLDYHVWFIHSKLEKQFCADLSSFKTQSLKRTVRTYKKNSNHF